MTINFRQENITAVIFNNPLSCGELPMQNTVILYSWGSRQKIQCISFYGALLNERKLFRSIKKKNRCFERVIIWVT